MRFDDGYDGDPRCAHGITFDERCADCDGDEPIYPLDCGWCRQTIRMVAYEKSTGICDSCLAIHFAEDVSDAAA
jgi:hypothetical protein